MIYVYPLVSISHHIPAPGKPPPSHPSGPRAYAESGELEKAPNRNDALKALEAVGFRGGDGRGWVGLVFGEPLGDS